MGKEDVSATWVHERSLSLDVISEYEKGIATEINVQESSRGGQTSVTAVVDRKEDTPPSKKSKTERWITPSSSGYFTC